MRRRAAGAIGRRCARAGRRIRRSSGVAQRAGGTGRTALASRPWPRVLLWVFASAALVVSTMMRADAVREREAGVSVRAAATERSWTTQLPLPDALIRPGGAGALSARRGPEG